MKRVELLQQILLRSSVLLAVLGTLGAYGVDLDKPEARAIKLATEPVFDGKVIGDLIWQQFEPLTDFTQHSPDNGAAPSERTEVYFGFTDEVLFLAVVCYENDLDNIVVSNNGWESDSIAVAIDTFNTELHGFTFSTNPVGAEWDATVHAGNTDWNWATKWAARAQMIEQGWSAELRIPFKSLRYGNQKVQSWGVNFARVMRKRNEISHWAKIPRHRSVFRFDEAGVIHGIEAPPQPKNLKFNPYAVTRQSDDIWRGDERDTTSGFDVKYSLSPRMTMDLTYNTDFAQVESDQLQVNLGRFSLFFPETRPFFLENAGIFRAGSIYRTILFHSRTIGIAPDGRRLPIDGGIRLTGRVAKATNIGFLHMRSEGADRDSASDFTVARIRQDFPNRTNIGFIGVNRKDGDSSNQAVATDFRLGVGDSVDYAFTVAKTRTNDIDEDDYAFAISRGYSSPEWNVFTYYGEVGGGFNPAAGFVGRRDIRSIYIDINHTHAIDDFINLQEWKHLTWYSRTHNFDGHLESSNLHIESWAIARNGSDMWVAVDFNSEGVRESFSIAGVPIPAGNYKTTEYTFAFNSPTSHSFRIGLNLVQGGFYNGDRFNAGLGLNYLRDESFNAWLNYNHNRIDLPTKDDAFTADLASIGFNYSFTPKMNFQAQFQYNLADDIYAANARFAWMRTANAGLYLVYSEVEGRGSEFGPKREEIALKYSHIFDVLN